MTAPDTGIQAKLGALLTPVADKLWGYFEPKIEVLITDVINQTLETWLPKIIKAMDDNMDVWMPRIIKAVIIATVQAVRGIAVNSEDKLTDLIPGTVDDAVFDPIVKNVSDLLGKIGL